jgi:glycosyltransferase involved in cell wall biosynthesis
MGKVFTGNDVEILIATMNRNNLDFLSAMFPFKHFSNFNLLVVNQSKTSIVSSEYPSVRVINSADIGLSKSRNLALENAIGKILIIADDDVIYQESFIKNSIDAYIKFEHACVINFCATKQNGRYLKKYPTHSKKQLNSFDIFNVSSIEMTINKERLDLLGIRFDENFGLGGKFEMGEEAVFLFDLKHKKQQIAFENQVLVMHKSLTSSNKMDSLHKYYILGAVFTRVSKTSYLFWLITKLFFDLKQNKIKLNSFFKALKSAKEGQKKMKSIPYGK